MKKNIMLVLLSFLLIGLVACSNDTEETISEPEPETDPVEEQEPEVEPELPNVYPLTGVRTDQEVDNRIVSVMINNHPKARPQTGLSQADTVMEILAEYNITRLLAFYQSEQPNVVGPVRSAREYYFNTADDYDALYVYHGAAGFIEDMLKNGAADYLNGAYYDNDGHLFERADFRVAPHNSYLQFDAVYEVAEEKGYEVTVNHEPLPFLEEDEEIDGTAVSEILFYYTSTPVRYVYDAASEVYLRYNGEEQTVELDTEESVQLDNVFLVETHHEVIDDAGRREVDLESGGNAYLLQKGKLQKIQWANRNGRIIPIRDGEEVGLVPGKTWINFIPEDPGLSEVEEIE